MLAVADEETHVALVGAEEAEAVGDRVVAGSIKATTVITAAVVGIHRKGMAEKDLTRVSPLFRKDLESSRTILLLD